MSQETPKPPVVKFMSAAIHGRAQVQATIQTGSETHATLAADISEISAEISASTPNRNGVPDSES